MLKDKRIFISGGAGVIGTTLIKKLYEMGAIIFVGDLKPRPKDWPKDIIYRQGDLNYVSKEELLAFDPEYFFHLAATFERSTETYDFWDENYHHNVNLSHHLMTCLKDSQTLKKIIFASSYLIYDPKLYSFAEPAEKAVRLKETDPIYPRNLTGMAKLFHEIELGFLGGFENTGFETVCARIYRSYGRNSRDVISRWIRSLLEGETLTVYKKEGLFDYIFADEVAEGLIRLATTQANGVVNLGSDNARRVEEVLEVLKKHFPEMKVEYVDVDMPYEASQANMDYFRELTGWAPSRQLEDVIPKLIEHERIAGAEDTLSRTSANILVTSVSTKVPLVRAVRKASLKLGNTGKVFGADMNPNCTGRYFVDSFWQMPRLDDLSIDNLVRYCQENNITCIVPSRDGELPFFAQYKAELAQHGISVMVPDYEAAQVCYDKLLFYEKVQAMGYPAIKTVVSIDGVDCDTYVIKERYGAGAREIGLNLTKEQAMSHATTLENPVFQPYIDGKEMSVELYVDAKGATKGVIVRERQLVVHGESHITTTLREHDLEELCSRLAEELKLYGHTILQVMVDGNGNFHIVECNTRFGGASPLSIEAGLDSLYWFLLESTGEDLRDYPFVRSSSEKKLIRHAKDLIL